MTGWRTCFNTLVCPAPLDPGTIIVMELLQGITDKIEAHQTVSRAHPGVSIYVNVFVRRNSFCGKEFLNFLR